MSGILGTEVNAFTSPTLTDNDKAIYDAVRAVYSRGNFALNKRDYTVTGTVDFRDSVLIGDTTAGAVTLTLLPWNYYQITKTPVLLIYKKTGANALTINAASGDTIDGSGSTVIATGELRLLIATAANVWTSRIISPGGGGTGDLLAANNLSDLLNAATARTNLGLGTIAVENTPLAVSKGGTGQASVTAGRIMYGDGTNAFPTDSTLTFDATTDTFTANPCYANVKAYGALGNSNGTTGNGNDDTAEIQAAMDAGFTAVYFPAGIYRISAALTSTNKPLTIFGDGDDSVIYMDGTANALTFTGKRYIRYNDQLVVKNIKIVTTGDAAKAISASFTDDATITGNEYKITAQTPVVVHNVNISVFSDTASWTHGLYVSGAVCDVRHCKISPFDWTASWLASSVGIEVLSTPTNTDFVIEDCILDKAESGLKVTGSIEGLHFLNNTVFAIYGLNIDETGHSAGQGLYYDIAGNHFNCADYCIRLKGVLQNFIHNNLFYAWAHTTGHNTWRAIYIVQHAATYKHLTHINNNIILPADLTSGDPYTTAYGIYVEGNSGTNKARNILIASNYFGNSDSSAVNTADIYLDSNTTEVVVTNTNLSPSRTNQNPTVTDNGTGNIVSTQRVDATPAVTAGSGTFTTVAGARSVQKDHGIATVHIKVDITTNGTAGGWVVVPLGFTAAKNCVLAGRETVTGFAVHGIVFSGGTDVLIFKDDNTYPGASGGSLTVSGQVYI